MVTPGWVNRREPDKDEIDAVIRSAGMQAYVPMMPFRESAGQGEVPGMRRRPPERRRQKWVGPYFIQLEGRRDNCIIRLSIYNFKQGALTLKATWSGYEKAACDHQFERTVKAAESAIAGRGWNLGKL